MAKFSKIFSSRINTNATLSLEMVKKQMDHWRNQHQGRRSIIPAELWQNILPLLDHYPKSRVLRTLAISTTQLNRQLLSTQTTSPTTASPDFLAIPLSKEASVAQPWRIEITTEKGCRFDIHIPATQAIPFIQSLLNNP